MLPGVADRRILAGDGAGSAQLLFLDFIQRLAIDTQRGRGPGLQPFYPDFDATDLAKAVVAGVQGAQDLEVPGESPRGPEALDAANLLQSQSACQQSAFSLAASS